MVLLQKLLSTLIVIDYLESGTRFPLKSYMLIWCQELKSDEVISVV